MKKFRCEARGYIYDPARSDTDNNVPPGLPLRKYRTTGYVRFAAWARMNQARGGMG